MFNVQSKLTDAESRKKKSSSTIIIIIIITR